MGVTSKWDFFLRFPSGTFIVPKFLLLIYFSNQACLEHAREISYSCQRDISNGVWHTPIKVYLTLVSKGFVVGSENFNLTFDLSFEYNSCISGLNKWCKGILGSYILKHFQWYFEGPNWCSFSLSIKVLNIIPHECMNSYSGSALWKSLGSLSCILPHLWECVSFLNILLQSLTCFYTPHLITNPMLGLWQYSFNFDVAYNFIFISFHDLC